MTDLDLDAIEARANTDHRPMWIDILLDDTPTHGGAVRYDPGTEGRGGVGTWAVDIADWVRAVLADHADLIAEVRRLRAAVGSVDETHRPHDCDDEDGMCCWAEEVPGEGYVCQLVGACDHDGYLWPCPTHTALHPDSFPLCTCHTIGD